MDDVVAKTRAELGTQPRLDLQEHLADLEARGLLTRIDHPVNKDTELHPLVRLQFIGGIPEAERRAFLFTNVVDGTGRKYDMPVVVGSIAASAEIYSLGMRAEVEDIGKRWMEAIARPIPPIRTNNARCQEVVITGDELRKPDGGLKLLPVPVSTPGFDSAPYLSATFCVTKDPDSGIQNAGTYRAALKATDRAVVRMVARPGGAGGYLHWEKYNKRKQPMPIAIVVGAAPVVTVHRRAKARRRSRRACRRRRARRPAGAGGEVRHRRSRRACRRRDRDRRSDRSGEARARGAVRREQRLCRARSLQHADAGHRDHASQERRCSHRSSAR